MAPPDDPTDASDPTDPPSDGDGEAAVDADAEVAADRRRFRIALGVGLALAAVGLVVALVLVASDDDEVATEATTTETVSEPGSTTPTSAPSTTASTSTPPTSGSASGSTTAPAPLSPDEVAFALWPDPASATRYDDPRLAAAGFAEDLVGFTDPVVGGFQQGDSRSGEVPIRARADGPVTTVLVRQLGADDAWFVIAALTEDIELDEPVAQSAIDDPLLLSGRARAFEGTVLAAVHGDGAAAPLGTGVLTATGDGTLGPFSGEVRWTNPGGGWGSVILYTESAEDGRVWQATAVRVGFIGGD